MKSPKKQVVKTAKKQVVKPKAPKAGDHQTYRNNPAFRTAFVYNARKNDVVAKPGSSIPKGVILFATQGYIVTQAALANVACEKAKIVAFKANAKCSWNGKEYPCMHFSDQNYAVAKTPQGLRNVELRRFAGQTKENRAALC